MFASFVSLLNIGYIWTANKANKWTRTQNSIHGLTKLYWTNQIHELTKLATLSLCFCSKEAWSTVLSSPGSKQIRSGCTFSSRALTSHSCLCLTLRYGFASRASKFGSPAPGQTHSTRNIKNTSRLWSDLNRVWHLYRYGNTMIPKPKLEFYYIQLLSVCLTWDNHAGKALSMSNSKNILKGAVRKIANLPSHPMGHVGFGYGTATPNVLINLHVHTLNHFQGTSE